MLKAYFKRTEKACSFASTFRKTTMIFKTESIKEC